MEKMNCQNKRKRSAYYKGKRSKKRRQRYNDVECVDLINDPNVEQNDCQKYENNNRKVVLDSRSFIIVSDDDEDFEHEADDCQLIPVNVITSNKESKLRDMSPASTEDYLSSNVNLINFLTTEVNPIDSLTTKVIPVDSISKDVNPVDSLSTEVNSIDFLSKDVNPIDSISEDVSPLDSLSTEVNLIDSSSSRVNRIDSSSIVLNPIDSSSMMNSIDFNMLDMKKNFYTNLNQQLDEKFCKFIKNIIIERENFEKFLNSICLNLPINVNISTGQFNIDCDNGKNLFHDLTNKNSNLYQSTSKMFNLKPDCTCQNTKTFPIKTSNQELFSKFFSMACIYFDVDISSDFISDFDKVIIELSDCTNMHIGASRKSSVKSTQKKRTKKDQIDTTQLKQKPPSIIRKPRKKNKVQLRRSKSNTKMESQLPETGVAPMVSTGDVYQFVDGMDQGIANDKTIEDLSNVDSLKNSSENGKFLSKKAKLLMKMKNQLLTEQGSSVEHENVFDDQSIDSVDQMGNSSSNSVLVDIEPPPNQKVELQNSIFPNEDTLSLPGENVISKNSKNNVFNDQDNANQLIDLSNTRAPLAKLVYLPNKGDVKSKKLKTRIEIVDSSTKSLSDLNVTKQTTYVSDQQENPIKNLSTSTTMGSSAQSISNVTDSIDSQDSVQKNELSAENVNTKHPSEQINISSNNLSLSEYTLNATNSSPNTVPIGTSSIIQSSVNSSVLNCILSSSSVSNVSNTYLESDIIKVSSTNLPLPEYTLNATNSSPNTVPIRTSSIMQSSINSNVPSSILSSNSISNVSNSFSSSNIAPNFLNSLARSKVVYIIPNSQARSNKNTTSNSFLSSVAVPIEANQLTDARMSSIQPNSSINLNSQNANTPNLHNQIMNSPFNLNNRPVNKQQTIKNYLQQMPPLRQISPPPNIPPQNIPSPNISPPMSQPDVTKFPVATMEQSTIPTNKNISTQPQQSDSNIVPTSHIKMEPKD